MEWFINNWYIIVAFVILAAFAVSKCVDFKKKPTQEQINTIIEWLKYWVFVAEKDLGSGTGQLKLRAVYDAFLQRFPSLALVITFTEFSKYVDDALEWMNKQLESNKRVASLVDNKNTMNPVPVQVVAVPESTETASVDKEAVDAVTEALEHVEGEIVE